VALAPGGKARTRKPFAFTLIELLVVIAIISLLAAMIFPITKALNRNKLRTRAKGELALLQTAIESYKSKIGVYPPDNPGNPVTNQLYYELLGTVVTNSGTAMMFRTVDGSSEVPGESALLALHFGPNVRGFVNTARPGGGDEASGGVNFLVGGLPPSQVGEIPNSVKIIASSVKWPLNMTYQPVPTVKGLNPWRYNSSSPTNNSNGYDLWLDFIVDGKTNRISNWSREVLVP
jgi:prepilin-type N-terminal cleavage/methylation domain-containing protein